MSLTVAGLFLFSVFIDIARYFNKKTNEYNVGLFYDFFFGIFEKHICVISMDV